MLCLFTNILFVCLFLCFTYNYILIILYIFEIIVKAPIEIAHVISSFIKLSFLDSYINIFVLVRKQLIILISIEIKNI